MCVSLLCAFLRRYFLDCVRDELDQDRAHMLETKEKEKEVMKGQWERQFKLAQLSRHQQRMREGRIGMSERGRTGGDTQRSRATSGFADSEPLQLMVGGASIGGPPESNR